MRMESWVWIRVIFIWVNSQIRWLIGMWKRERVKDTPENPILGNLGLKVLWQWSHGVRKRTCPWNLFMIRAVRGFQIFFSCCEYWSLLFRWEIQMEQEKILTLWGISVLVSYFKKIVWLWNLDAEITKQTLKISTVFGWTLLKKWLPAPHVYELLHGQSRQLIFLASAHLCNFSTFMCVSLKLNYMCDLASLRYAVSELTLPPSIWKWSLFLL